jgi:hypothetical protein
MDGARQKFSQVWNRQSALNRRASEHTADDGAALESLMIVDESAPPDRSGGHRRREAGLTPMKRAAVATAPPEAYSFPTYLTSLTSFLRTTNSKHPFLGRSGRLGGGEALVGEVDLDQFSSSNRRVAVSLFWRGFQAKPHALHACARVCITPK